MKRFKLTEKDNVRVVKRVQGMGLGGYLKKVADRLEAAETPREAEVASWFLEATIKTILEGKGVQIDGDLD